MRESRQITGNLNSLCTFQLSFVFIDVNPELSRYIKRQLQIDTVFLHAKFDAKPDPGVLSYEIYSKDISTRGEGLIAGENSDSNPFRAWPSDHSPSFCSDLDSLTSQMSKQSDELRRGSEDHLQRRDRKEDCLPGKSKLQTAEKKE